MKVLFISDIHAHYDALMTMKAELESADHILCLGDIVGYNTQVNEVIDYLRSLNNLTCILGNHDDFLLRGCPVNLLPAVKKGIDFAAEVIKPDNKKWLANLPLSWGGIIDNKSFMLVHGSPWHPFNDYLYPNNPLIHQLDAFHYDVIAFGQTHRALIREEKKPYLINPGSIGQSRDKQGIACAMMLETQTMMATPIEREIHQRVDRENA